METSPLKQLLGPFEDMASCTNPLHAAISNINLNVTSRPFFPYNLTETNAAAFALKVKLI